jgi:hypothetical protein
MRTTKTVLKLNGQPFNPYLRSPALLRVIQFFQSAPKDEIYTAREVAAKLRLHFSYLKDKALDPQLAPYSHLVGPKRYYGNPAAIAELKRQMETK